MPSGVAAAGGRAGALRRAAGGLPARGAAGACPAPRRMRAMTWPTVTVSPSAASSSVMTPAAGAGSSTSTLSVEISTIVSPSATLEPTSTCHSSSVPSVTDSPAPGVTMSTISPAPSAGGASAAGGGARAAPLPAAPLPDAPSGQDLREHRADRDRVALGGVDLHDGAGDRRGDLGVDLVGRDLDERLVGLDVVALGLVPLEDGALGHRLAHRRQA